MSPGLNLKSEFLINIRFEVIFLQNSFYINKYRADIRILLLKEMFSIF